MIMIVINMKKAILILNTKLNKSFDYLINKIAISYSLKTFYLDDMSNISKSGIISEINKFNDLNNTEIAFFQGDYISFIDLEFIKNIKVQKKILYSTDDFDTHEINLINGTGCDIILSACPTTALRFQEKNMEAYYVPLESDDKILKKYSDKKENDILFFGKIKADREEYLNSLIKAKFKLKIIGSNKTNRVSETELAKSISNSKIVLNLAQTGKRNKFYSHKTIPLSNLQIKGRPIMAGLCGTLCVSEYSPQTEMVYGNSCPIFNSHDEMLNIIKDILNNPEELKRKTDEFCNKSKYYADSNYFPIISEKINNCKVRPKKKYTLPFWYKYVFFKKMIQLYFRGLKKKILKK